MAQCAATVGLVISSLLLAPTIGEAAMIPQVSSGASDSAQVGRSYAGIEDVRLGPVGAPASSPPPSQTPSSVTAVATPATALPPPTKVPPAPGATLPPTATGATLPPTATDAPTQAPRASTPG